MREELLRFAKYGTTGVVVNAIAYGFFIAVYYAGVPPVTSAGASYILAVLMSYFVNRIWAFQSTATHSRDATRYILAYMVGFFWSVFGMTLLSRILAPEFAWLCMILTAPIIIYGALRLSRFGL